MDAFFGDHRARATAPGSGKTRRRCAPSSAPRRAASSRRPPRSCKAKAAPGDDLMLVLDHDRAGGYWGAVYVFTAIKGLQVVIDGPVGCENLPVTSVLHYTDALPPARTADRRHGPGRGAARPRRHRRRDEARARSAGPRAAGVVVTGIDRRDDRRRRHAGRHRTSSGSCRAPSTKTSGRCANRAMLPGCGSSTGCARSRPARLRASEAGTKPRVNILGPMPTACSTALSDLAEIRRLVEGIGCEVNMVFPLGSHLADVGAWLVNADVNVVPVPRVRPPAVRGAGAPVPAGAHRPAQHDRLPARPWAS